MLNFRTMTEKEFQDYMKISVPNYIADLLHYEDQIKANYKTTAKELAEKQFTGLLPEGMDTEHNYFWKVVTEQNTVVGDVWFFFLEKKALGYLADILVLEQHRNQGFGTEILWKIDDICKQEHHATAIMLSVFKHNPRAKKLYEKLGYRVVQEHFAGFQMIKEFL